MALEKDLKKDDLLDDSNTDTSLDNSTDNNLDNQIKIIIPTDDEVKEEKEETKEEINTPEQKIKLRMYELDLKIEECEVKLDELENKILIDPEDYDTQQEYLSIKKEEKGYVKEKKSLQKELNSFDSSALNKVSIWVIIFGIISIIISFPLITQILWLDAAQFIIDALAGAFSGVPTDSVLFRIIEFLLIFIFPLILNLITWLLFVNLVKTKTDNKAFSIMWIIQGVLSLGTIIYMCTILYR